MLLKANFKNIILNLVLFVNTNESKLFQSVCHESKIICINLKSLHFYSKIFIQSESYKLRLFRGFFYIKYRLNSFI